MACVVYRTGHKPGVPGIPVFDIGMAYGFDRLEKAVEKSYDVGLSFHRRHVGKAENSVISDIVAHAGRTFSVDGLVHFDDKMIVMHFDFLDITMLKENCLKVAQRFEESIDKYQKKTI